METKSSVDAIRPFCEILRHRKDLPTTQIIGGICMAALAHQDTIIDAENHLIIAPDSADLSNRRDDGTKRDCDILVVSSDPTNVDCLARECIEPNLDVSAFGLKPFNDLTDVSPYMPGNALDIKHTYLSERYEDSENNIIRAVYPWSVPIDPSCFETWTLNIKDTEIPVPNPAMSLVNYATRSISGLRSKDEAKVLRASNNVLSKAPELRDWAFDGPAADQVELARIIRSLTPALNKPDIFGFGERNYTRQELADHEAFMSAELPEVMRRRIVGEAAFKAYVLATGESFGFIRTFWYNHVENNKILGTLVTGRE